MHSRRSRAGALLLLAGGLVSGWGVAQEASAPLTSAAAVLSLSAEQASRRLPIEVSGVVTAAEPDWKGQFFVQDGTGGVFVENLGRLGPVPGDVVSVKGVSHPGAFAPIISGPDWRKTGTAPLPRARQVLIEDLETGVEDGQRVEVTGTVRTARIVAGRLVLALAVGGFRLQVFAPVPPDLAPAALVAARVRVSGTTATHYNVSLRQLTSVAVYVPRQEDFQVVLNEQHNPFDQPAIQINTVAQYRRGRGADHRVHVRGVVTWQRTGAEIFLQDESGGICLDVVPAGDFQAGEVVDAAGFVEYENYLPRLRDAELRRTETSKQRVSPRRVSFLETSRGLHHGSLITLQGRLLDRATRPISRPELGFHGYGSTWLLQGDGMTFTVEVEGKGDPADLAAIPLGSILECDGVCVSTVDATGKLTALRLLLPALADARVLVRPSWFTPGRLLVGVGLLSVILIAAVTWLLTIARKNAALRTLIGEREQTQRALQEAHDTLEQKVAERTAQLQVEMTTRKAEELQFKAVLTERTRLARDLHDTLEQTLTGIALQLDTSAKLAGRDPTVAHNHLQLARSWLHQSQVDLRRSIWDLRSRELEQFDLASALRRSAEQLVEGTAIQLEFRTQGPPPSLPEVVEENVLRIGQEALTNIARHARAGRVIVTLDATPPVLRLRIEDDGVGFVQGQPPRPNEGHFGLVGMMERAKRLAGGLTIQSAPGRGTAVSLEVPIESTAGPGPTGRREEPVARP
jgi:signal transduction histidine kinase